MAQPPQAQPARKPAAGAGPDVASAPPDTTVFLSYSRADERQARKIVEALEEAGYAVWWDGLLGGGERFARSTAEALERARAVVVLWSKTSVESHWVQDEAAFGRDNARLVPLSLDGSQPPLGFRQFQVIDVTRARRDGPEMRQLVEAVAALHDRREARRTPRPTAEARGVTGRRAILAGGAAAVVGAGLAAGAWKAGWIGAPPPRANTIAVLPFENASREPGKSYFANGLCAELRAALARNAALRVIGQASSDVFTPNAADARQIFRKLGVSFLLNGSALVEGDAVRVYVELTENGHDVPTWSQTFQRSLKDIFAVQSELAVAVTRAITQKVTAGGTARTSGTDNVAAFDAYLRGKAAFALAAGAQSDREALADFEQAIAADPRFAAAHAARARTLVAIANQDLQGPERRRLYDAAVAAAQKAVALAPDRADGPSALAYALASGRLDVKGARAPYARSYQLGRGDPDIVARYALYCAQTGRFDEAESAIREAETLDPLNPRTFWNAGYIRYAARHYADARLSWRQALALNPQMGNAHAYIGYSLLMEGQAAPAETELGLEKNALTRLPGLAIAARREGQAGRAQAIFDQLTQDLGDNGLYQQAQVLAQWGQADRALDTLQKARTAGDSGLFLAGRDPFLDPLRNDPRFSRLLSELGFV